MGRYRRRPRRPGPHDPKELPQAPAVMVNSGGCVDGRGGQHSHSVPVGAPASLPRPGRVGHPPLETRWGRASRAPPAFITSRILPRLVPANPGSPREDASSTRRTPRGLLRSDGGSVRPPPRYCFGGVSRSSAVLQRDRRRARRMFRLPSQGRGRLVLGPVVTPSVLLRLRVSTDPDGRSPGPGDRIPVIDDGRNTRYPSVYVALNVKPNGIPELFVAV